MVLIALKNILVSPVPGVVNAGEAFEPGDYPPAPDGTGGRTAEEHGLSLVVRNFARAATEAESTAYLAARGREVGL